MRIEFSEIPPGIFRFVTLPLEIPEKTSYHLENSAKLCDTSWKFQDQKPRPAMEIPHKFSVTSHEIPLPF